MLVRILLVSVALSLIPAAAAVAAPTRSAVAPDVVDRTIQKLTAKFGEAQAERIRLGVRQVAERWWESDGDAEIFTAFCEGNFIADPVELKTAFDRLQQASEQIYGHIHEIAREMRRPLDLDTGPLGKADLLLGDFDPVAHVTDDLFKTKVAFLALLNLPVNTLGDRLTGGAGWNRGAWALSRMMDGFAMRVPADVNQEISKAVNAAGLYIDEYYIRLDRLVTDDGRRLFPEGKRLISHWGLRDELKSQYGQGKEGLEKQRMIRKVMERIVRQEIPQAVRDNADLLWNPSTNEVKPVPGAKVATGAKLDAREPDTRYRRLLGAFHAVRKADPYCPTAPTYMQRKFEIERQIPEKEVEALLTSVLASKEVKDLGAVVRKRLGRDLEPFDIWYSGFAPRSSQDEKKLDALVKAKYPTVAAFQEDVPRILKALGFSDDTAKFLAEHIVVDPSRGAGHAMGAVRREDKAHLRTRIPAGGMDYKGYNIAVHEMGHNVEQVFSLNGVDEWFLSGVPNNAFTEAFAFTFQRRDLELLGLGGADAEALRLEVLNDLWGTYEIAGVSLVDVAAWRWMYAHPDATPAELREAVLAAAREVWNKYYAPVFGVKDSEILAIYSHMIAYPLYLADYPLGHIIAFQVAAKLRGDAFGREFERAARQGRLTPDAWMRGAVGSEISTRALLEEARRAMAGLK